MTFHLKCYTIKLKKKQLDIGGYMKIQYWGTAAAEGVPGIFCNCETCRLARAEKGRKLRTRSQILINNDLLVDFGPETYTNSVKYDFNLSFLQHVIITHPHEDHLYSEEFEHRLNGFACEVGVPVLILHGSADTLVNLRRITDRVDGFNGQKRIIYDIMKPYETREIGNYFVTPLPAEHGTETPFVYLIEQGGKSILILNDTGRPSYEVYEYLIKRGIVLDAISFDTTYGFENVLQKYGKADHHMGLLDNVSVKGFLDMNGITDKHTVCIAHHFSHQGVDADYHKMCEHADKYGFLVSYDGMELEI